jgi:hypothetical protein
MTTAVMASEARPSIFRDLASKSSSEGRFIRRLRRFTRIKAKAHVAPIGVNLRNLRIALSVSGTPLNNVLQKNSLSPPRLNGQTTATQKPGESKVFLATSSSKKVTSCFFPSHA